MKVVVAIPTYNRCRCIINAVEAAITQSYEDTYVVVVDDCSTDETARVLKPYFSEPKFCYVRLGKNVGTAQAKNVALMLSDFDAITFHDSDDIPDRHKILLQTRALCQRGHRAEASLDWTSIGITPGRELQVDAVFTGHRLIRGDGSTFEICKRISMLDDFFPNMQFPSKTPGDWVLVNSGLFRRSVFESLGGYLESIEEDRELRNRVIATGHITYFLDQPLVDKIEMCDSLTVAVETNYEADHRMKDRRIAWDRLKLLKKLLWNGDRKSVDWNEIIVPVDLSGIELEEVSRPELLRRQSRIPHVTGSLPSQHLSPSTVKDTPPSLAHAS